MTERVPLNRHGREKTVKQPKSLQASKYLVEFDLKDDEEVMGITVGYVDEEDIEKVIAQDGVNGRRMPFIVVNAVLVWVPPKLIELE